MKTTLKIKVLASSALVSLAPAVASAAEELNVLGWCDHSDPALLAPFEAAHDVKVNMRVYEGTGSALALLSQSRPGDWDVFVIDSIDVFRAVENNLLAPMPADQLPLDDLFPEVVMADSNIVDGELYAITEKFGYNSIAYNSSTVDPADMDSYATILSDKYADRITIYDYYLPEMALAGVIAGIPTSEFSEDSLDAVRRVLEDMSAKAISVSDIVASQTALVTGEADIIFGVGETVTAALTAERPELTWTIPKEGAIYWTQSIGVMQDSAKPELALEFVKYIMSPEGQARLATSSCYWAMPANKKAAEFLTDNQRQALRWDEQAGYLARTQQYPKPDPELDSMMQDIWLETMSK